MSKNIKLITFSLLFILSSILLSIRELHTESPQNKMLLGSNYKETVKDNIILLVDNSGSMKTTDPSRLATVAASMLVDTLGPESSMNIIAFGDKIQTFSRLKDKPTPQALKNFMSGLDYGDNHTNLKDGLSEALDQLDEVEGTKRIIILSDGKEDPKGGLTKDHEDELNSLIERAYNSKVEIHTIGLSSLADEEMLNRISYRTGGNIFFSSNPAELFDIFNRIIGEAQGYYTLDRYSVASPGNREINFSSFVEEVVIKVASIDNKMPNVEVSENGKEISAEKYSDRYKIFGIKNSGDRSLKIQTLDNGKNLIIIQMKSRVGLKINTQDGSFQLPHRIPMDISCSLDVEDEIQGLHMDKVINGKREPLVKQDDKFIFRFQENDQGLYPIFITAYDGNNNIIAVKSVDINITDSPPFYYTDELPQEFIIGSSFTINLKQMDNTPVDSVSGEVIIDYGDIRDTFPLSIKDSTLSADISFRKAGEIRFGACINGIYNNSSFSYYLPENKMELLEQPHINIETLDNREALKKSKEATLRLKIIDNLTYGDEDITVYDDAGNNIGKFKVKKNQKGNIDVAITPLEKTSDLILKLNGSKELKLTEKIDTKKRVLDG
ncbi:MAG: vWA domain-containing protein, partial [Bacillota bacterium]|nr:vWA domain-containing protein [Bacillota bacterium]